MSTSMELATREEAGLVLFDQAKVDLLKRTICRGATNDELELFIHACKRTGLDPFMKQIHAVMRYDDKKKMNVMAIQTGIDGYRLIADRSGKYAGNDDPVFESDDKGPYQATCTVYKIVGGIRCPFTATARWDEYYPGDKGGFMWRKMPHVMLGKVAEALALRKAFPADLSGLYTFEEMEQAGPVVEAKPVQATPRELPTLKQIVDGDDFEPDEAEQFIISLGEHFDLGDFTPEQRDVIIAKVCRRKKVKNIRDLSPADRKAMLSALADGKFDDVKSQEVVTA